MILGICGAAAVVAAGARPHPAVFGPLKDDDDVVLQQFYRTGHLMGRAVVDAGWCLFQSGWCRILRGLQ